MRKKIIRIFKEAVETNLIKLVCIEENNFSREMYIRFLHDMVSVR